MHPNKSHCPSDLLHFEPGAYQYKGTDTFEHWPVAQLNMSALVLQRVAALRMELECVKWEQNEELCIGDPESRKERDGNESGTEYDRHWPCRLFDLGSLEQDNFTVRFPAAFHYACLRARPFTQFRLNVSLYPQNCESSYFMAIPSAECLEPDAGRNDWQPLVIVDTSDPEGVWVRLTAPPPDLDVGLVNVDIQTGEHSSVQKWTFNFSKVEERALSERNGSLASERKSGHLFTGLTQGKYSVKIKFLNRDKRLTDSHCQRDLVAYFWLMESKSGMSIVNGGGGLFRDWSLPVGLTLLGVVGVVFLIVGAVIWCLKRRVARRNLEASVSVWDEVTYVPKVLILYTDDSEQHRECILKLAHFLQMEGHCEVLLDEWALVSDTRLSPDTWLFRALEKADFYLIVFSEGSRLAFQGQELIRTRHWMELFNPGVTFVLQELLKECRSRSPLTSDPLIPYVWVRFDYTTSRCVEPFLKRLPVPKFELPSDLRRLLCHLHKLPFEFGSTGPNARELEHSVSVARRYYAQHPDWVSQRLRSSQGSDGSVNGAVSNARSGDITKLLADVGNLDLRTLGDSGLTLSVNQAYARFRNRPQSRNGTGGDSGVVVSSRNGALVCGATQSTDLLADASNQSPDNFDLVAPEDEANAPLVRKYQVIGSPDDSDSD